MYARITLIALLALAATSPAGGDAEYYRLQLEIDVDRPAAEVWSKVGGYCDIEDWLGLDCEITQGDGGIGTVRVLRGTIIEPMVAQTELSYGYTQPVVEGQYYTLYHGFMEARPVTATTSKVIYTMMWDISESSEEQVAADIERRRDLFSDALQAIKKIAEADER